MPAPLLSPPTSGKDFSKKKPEFRMNKGSEEHGLPAPWMIEPQYPGVKENPVKPERGLFPWSIELVPYEGAT